MTQGEEGEEMVGAGSSCAKRGHIPSLSDPGRCTICGGPMESSEEAEDRVAQLVTDWWLQEFGALLSACPYATTLSERTGYYRALSTVLIRSLVWDMGMVPPSSDQEGRLRFKEECAAISLEVFELIGAKMKEVQEQRGGER